MASRTWRGPCHARPTANQTSPESGCFRASEACVCPPRQVSSPGRDLVRLPHQPAGQRLREHPLLGHRLHRRQSQLPVRHLQEESVWVRDLPVSANFSTSVFPCSRLPSSPWAESRCEKRKNNNNKDKTQAHSLP